ncbi:hypothetical protein [Streptomyces sp. NBC_00076]|uniref:hypothetical protein n=1 Tax=Streptomyces sp. NBC_00076 TaxID=2975642 RepID=UPI0032548342
MTEYTLKCESATFDGVDDITASRDGSSVGFVARKRSEFAMDAYVSPNAARAFARGILALADEIDGGEVEAEETTKSAPIKVGDKVQIVRAEACSSHMAGRTGTVGVVDSDDPHLPYRVVDERGDYIAWAREVRKVDEPATLPGRVPVVSMRGDIVTQAKALLEGMEHTAADIIRLAEFLDAGK